MNQFGIYIGRFQPFHIAHQGIALEALNQVDKLLIVLGSADQYRTEKNPFTVMERSLMIQESLTQAGIAPNRVFVDSIPDVGNDSVWCHQLGELVKHYASNPILFGAEKDNTAYYLRQFPEWELRVLPVTQMLSATEIRKLYFAGQPFEHLVPAAVAQEMHNVKDTIFQEMSLSHV